MDIYHPGEVSVIQQQKEKIEYKKNKIKLKKKKKKMAQPLYFHWCLHTSYPPSSDWDTLS